HPDATGVVDDDGLAVGRVHGGNTLIETDLEGRRLQRHPDPALAGRLHAPDRQSNSGPRLFLTGPLSAPYLRLRRGKSGRREGAGERPIPGDYGTLVNFPIRFRKYSTNQTVPEAGSTATPPELQLMKVPPGYPVR